MFLRNENTLPPEVVGSWIEHFPASFRKEITQLFLDSREKIQKYIFYAKKIEQYTPAVNRREQEIHLSPTVLEIELERCLADLILSTGRELPSNKALQSDSQTSEKTPVITQLPESQLQPNTELYNTTDFKLTSSTSNAIRYAVDRLTDGLGLNTPIQPAPVVEDEDNPQNEELILYKNELKLRETLSRIRDKSNAIYKINDPRKSSQNTFDHEDKILQHLSLIIPEYEAQQQARLETVRRDKVLLSKANDLTNALFIQIKDEILDDLDKKFLSSQSDKTLDYLSEVLTEIPHDVQDLTETEVFLELFIAGSYNKLVALWDEHDEELTDWEFGEVSLSLRLFVIALMVLLGTSAGVLGASLLQSARYDTQPNTTTPQVKYVDIQTLATVMADSGINLKQELPEEINRDLTSSSAGYPSPTSTPGPRHLKPIDDIKLVEEPTTTATEPLDLPPTEGNSSTPDETSTVDDEPNQPHTPEPTATPLPSLEVAAKNSINPGELSQVEWLTSQEYLRAEFPDFLNAYLMKVDGSYSQGEATQKPGKSITPERNKHMQNAKTLWKLLHPYGVGLARWSLADKDINHRHGKVYGLGEDFINNESILYLDWNVFVHQYSNTEALEQLASMSYPLQNDASYPDFYRTVRRDFEAYLKINATN